MLRATLTLAILALGTMVAQADVVADCNQTRDLDRTIRACSRYIQIGSVSPQNLAVAYLNRGNAYSRQRKFGQALADFSSAIQLDPDSALPYYNRGNAHFDQGDDAKSIADYTSAIEKEPGFALAFYNRGLAQERQGHRQAAAADYRRALELNPNDQRSSKRLDRLQQAR